MADAHNKPASTGTARHRELERYLRDLADSELQLTIRLVLAMRMWRATIDDRLRPIRQSAARMEALSAILTAPGSQQVDIAHRLRIEGPSLTRMIHVLESEGLVTRDPDPRDGRSKLLALTDAGEDALEQVFARTHGLRRELLGDFPPETLALVNEVLATLLERLDAGLAFTAES